jgi:S1-C subfamily serine protease
MKKPSCHLVPIALVVLTGALVLAGCSGDPSASPIAQGAGGGGDPSGGAAGGSSPSHLSPLGITGRPSTTQPPGLLVTGFTPSPEPSALKVIGVEEEDVIVACNGQREHMRDACLAAIEGLQERGEPITLLVLRDGQQVELTRTERLPDAPSSEAPE